MSANTETTGADRAGCKPWCGRTDQMPANGGRYGAPFQSDFRYWDTADGEVPSELVGKPMWCSSDCRDARLPPIAAPAAHIDATPEPAKACESCGGNESTCGVHGCPGGKIKTCPTCEWAMSDCACTPPAQEAPKAAPVCCDPFGNSVHHVEVLKRTWKAVHQGGAWTLRTDWLCNLCLSENEPSGGGSDVLHNDDTPERLPRPQLAADWVEDCLGDVR